jgi:hypothetical protein
VPAVENRGLQNQLIAELRDGLLVQQVPTKDLPSRSGKVIVFLRRVDIYEERQ